jgi:hypothetical protein
MKKDFTLGMFLMVLSQFFLVAVFYVIQPIAWYLFPVVVFCSHAYMILMGIGYKIAFEGVKINAS